MGLGATLKNVADTVVGSFPDSGTLTQTTQGSYNTSTGGGGGDTSTSTAVNCKIGRYRTTEIGESIRQGDVPVFLPAKQVTTTPDTDDTFTIGSTVYQVVDVERIYTEGVEVAYRLQLRAGGQ